MNTRIFYFLRDSVTQKFYTGESLVLDGFDKAAVYFQRKNAEKRLKSLIGDEKFCGSWKWLKENWAYGGSNLNSYAKTYPEETKKTTELVNERKNLPNWGIEIVEVVVKV